MRLPLLAGAIILALISAGCTTPGATRVGPAQTSAQSLLAHPPGSDVQPTGVTKDFTLYVHRMTHELYPGASMAMWGFSVEEDPTTATLPGPTLRVTEGDTVAVTLRAAFGGYNHTIHWHGQNVPYEMDGVPYVSQPPVEPGQDFTYTFVAKPSGTYWYHCHVDAQHHIDMGMYGVLIVDPQDPQEDPAYDKEFLVVLDDMDRYHLEGGQPATGNLPQGGDLYSTEDYAKRQANDLVTKNPQLHERSGATPARPARDWYPTTYPPYTANYQTFLINGQAFPHTAPLLVAEGDVIRLRFINAGNTFFAMHLHGHHVLITHKDGVLLQAPYWADTILIGPGERYDAYTKMDNPGLWDFHDHIGGHTQNDNIFPGGAMTMLVYEQFADDLPEGHRHHAQKRSAGG